MDTIKCLFCGQNMEAEEKLENFHICKVRPHLLTNDLLIEELTDYIDMRNCENGEVNALLEEILHRMRHYHPRPQLHECDSCINKETITQKQRDQEWRRTLERMKKEDEGIENNWFSGQIA